MLKNHWKVVITALAGLVQVCLATSSIASQPAQTVGPTCLQYGVNRTYGDGWATMALIRRGERPGRKGLYALYEVLVRMSYAQRSLVDRTGLVVEGPAWATYNKRGGISGYHRDEWTNVRPEPEKPNAYYVHTTVTAQIGSTLSFAGAAANGPDLVFWGPIDQGRVV